MNSTLHRGGSCVLKRGAAKSPDSADRSFLKARPGLPLEVQEPNRGVHNHERAFDGRLDSRPLWTAKESGKEAHGSGQHTHDGERREALELR